MNVRLLHTRRHPHAAARPRDWPHVRRPSLTTLAVTVIGLGSVVAFQPSAVHAGAPPATGQHVLLISVDGLHASDLAQWVAAKPQSTLAALQRSGTTYTNAATSMPSDSFPGLLAMLTGGTPKSTGVYYDNSYSRDAWEPGSDCTGTPGAHVEYAENIDRGAIDALPLFGTIDPAKLPMGIVGGQCVPLYPHTFLQTNTIFNVARTAGLYTAWVDKHPAYEIVHGPSGAGVNDLFTPEINNGDNPTGTSVKATADYDQMKVQAILNEIDGKTSDGTQAAPVPAIFGMNFQAVSVGQKLVNPMLSCASNTGGGCDPGYVPGGYLPGSLKFTPQLTEAMRYVDSAIGSMLSELQAQGLSNSTEVIISAKHGQSPIDPAKLAKIGDPISKILTAAGIDIGQNTTDDVSLIWLKDQGQTGATVAALMADKQGANTAKIDTILSGAALTAQFGDPTQNPRTPDLIIKPQPGTIYTGSKAKVSEHGGFSEDDTHVALIVANPTTAGGQTVSVAVTTTQIAPTILRYLGLDAGALQSVRSEGTEALPR